MRNVMYDELVRGLLSILGNQTVRIVLYGSTARGTAGPESDVDIAIFLTSKLDVKQEDRLSDLIVDLNLKYNKVFSVVDIDHETYLKWRNVAPFYQNVDKEGIVLWEAGFRSDADHPAAYSGMAAGQSSECDRTADCLRDALKSN